ncbi:hypothetical protein [Natrinema sp. 1APR25-10V2]|uniref:hypothetical protein n=1 Tax=Natrinema sp. 1APR25-10V2 TaxID=2951081 RepID=UPI002876D302|nr:hypothetical protein [Natrinema sp. 1APR25-10V2]MDS0473805.1 hypothetical protein [Natrinema sp. 1APR25-10V2]
MSDQQRATRRRVLRLTGIAASTALVAGCGGPGGEENDTGDNETEAEEGTGNGQAMENETENETGNMTGNETNETGNMTNETGNMTNETNATNETG